jgi:hypothetical protein
MCGDIFFSPIFAFQNGGGRVGEVFSPSPFKERVRGEVIFYFSK